MPTYLGYPSVQGLYLDDQMSGYTIYNNTFKSVQTGIMIGGGRRCTGRLFFVFGSFPMKLIGCQDRLREDMN